MADERPRASPVQAPRPERQIAFRTGISAESRAAATTATTAAATAAAAAIKKAS